MKPRRRPRKGVLTRLRESPNRKSKRASLPVRVLQWVGGLIFAALMLGAVVLLAARFLRPDLTMKRDTTVTTVSEVRPEAEGGRPGGVVAEAVVQIEHREVHIPLDAAQASRVRPGSELSVTYTYDPGKKRVRVDDWSPVP